MVLEEFWGDASSRTIDLRVARMRVATGFTTCWASFGSRRQNKIYPWRGIHLRTRPAISESPNCSSERGVKSTT